MGIKIIEHNLLKDHERLIEVDNRLLQIRKEYEVKGALLDTKEWENLNIPQKYPINLNNRIDLDIDIKLKNESTDPVLANKIKEEKDDKEKSLLHKGQEDYFKEGATQSIFFVKCLTAVLWFYLAYKLVGDVIFMWKWVDIYMHSPDLSKLPQVEPQEPSWADQFLTRDKLEKMEGVITGETLGDLVINEDSKMILFKTKSFIAGLEGEVGLSAEDRKLINDNITWKERKMLYWLIDVIKELWVKGFEEERSLILARIIVLLEEIRERSKK